MIVLDVGSENTKMTLLENGEIVYSEIKNIPFKKNYLALQKIAESDLAILSSYIKELKMRYSKIAHIFATSVFRNLSKKEQMEIKNYFKKELGVDFKIISQEEESYYTAKSVFKNMGYRGKIAVLITGGGSTEISIWDNGKLLEEANTEMGVVAITNAFPELSEDFTSLDVREINDFIRKNMSIPKTSVEVLIVCGGAVQMFFELAEYPLIPNKLYDNKDHAFMMYAQDELEADIKFYKSNLSYYKNKMKDNPKWWNGCRAAQAIVNTIITDLDIKYIIPTNVGMTYALAAEITHFSYST